MSQEEIHIYIFCQLYVNDVNFMDRIKTKNKYIGQNRYKIMLRTNNIILPIYNYIVNYSHPNFFSLFFFTKDIPQPIE